MLQVTDEDTGLEAWITVDSVEEGLTTGGIRRASYETAEQAIREAKGLARSRTLACRAAELPSGGAATVLRDSEELEATRAYRMLGRQVDRLDPTYLCGPDLGTGEAELDHVREVTDRVTPEAHAPARATAVGVLSGIQAVCWALDGDPSVEGNSFLVQGYGAVGSFVAHGLADKGAKTLVAETDAAARQEAEDAGFTLLDPQAWTEQACDVLVPCAPGVCVTAEDAQALEARGICGAAERPLATRKAAEILAERNVQYAPAPIVNGGALVEAVLTWKRGDSRRVQDEIDRRLSDVYERTRRVLAEAADREVPSDDVVQERWG